MYTIFIGVEGYFGSLLVCNKDLECLSPWEKSIEHASYQYHVLQNYLMKTKHPLIPVTCIKEGQESKDFNAVFKWTMNFKHHIKGDKQELMNF
jgi:hypothetical protein